MKLMKCSTILGAALAFGLSSGMIAAAEVAAAAVQLDPTAPLTDAMAAQLSQNVDRPVIVLLKNQLSGAEAVSDQAPLMRELGRVRAAGIKQFQTVNSFAATVSEGEIARLRANPAVAAVVPDVMIRLTPRAAAKAAAASTSTTPSLPTTLTPHVIPGACGPNGAVLLEPEALQTTHTDSLDPHALTARSLGFTGKGVKVAWIADGIDPYNVNFLRADGTSVFIDYQDFSGDGRGQPTDGGEAFVDANAIGGQGLQVYNVNGFSAQPDPGACNVRIEGMAPGASLVGLDAIGTYEYAVTSNFLQAIEYAVLVDHVDVINESFGDNPFPDVTSQDITKQFNEAAVRAGVTVTVSSGDAGFTNTIGSAATDPAVIAVGASTTFRTYAQTNYAAARYFATTGWLNDNISSLSSGGYEETGTTIDLVAPGDITLASCDASATYAGCTNFKGQSSNIEESGGTSLSSPLTAGAAALVIEAYRKSHHGASPSPALVKQILTSTATDLGVPATEQGAGLLNTYKAVLLAQSINTSRYGSQPAVGQSLLLSESQLNAVDAPGTTEHWQVSVTNTGSSPQSVHVQGRTFGSESNIQKGHVTLTDGVNAQFANYQGLQNNYAVFSFQVPGDTDRLNASIAYPGDPTNGLNARVRLILIDPQGRFAAHSLPQGVGNFGNVDVRQPSAGTWTGVIFGDVAADNGTNGRVPWRVSTQKFAPFGSVSPDSFSLAPGHSQTIDVSASTPSSPGDASGSIVLTASGGGNDPYVGIESNSIPVTLRSEVNLAHGGNFSGVLTGGNGRDPGEGQIDYYQFNVGPGHSSITANVSLTNDAGDAVGAYLVNPDGVVVGYGEDDNGSALSAYTLNPVAGNWTLIVDFAEPVIGDEISQPFSGNISLDGIHVSASGLPTHTSHKLKAGVPVVVPVTITNTGVAPEQYFVDARLNSSSSIVLAPLFPPATSSGYSLPLGSSTSNPYTPEWLLPSETSSVKVAASATLPIEFDYGPAPGDPDLFGPPTSPKHAAGSYTPAGGTVSPGVWYANPDQIGPYLGTAPSGFVNVSMTATTKNFDLAVTPDGGDAWLASVQGLAVFNTFTGVIINPGESGVINVTITPSGSPGTVVTGTLYVDDFVGAVPPYFQTTGDELAALPYAYTID